MGHCGYITTLNNVRPHPNADRLVLANCFKNTVCVAKDTYTEGQIGVYFETDLQLSMEYCEKNGLLAVYENGVNVSGGYMDPTKRNVRAIKLRGEQSDGLFMPLDSLAYTGVNMEDLKIGDQITVLNGHEICRKYIPHRPQRGNATVAGGAGKRTKRRAKRSIAPTFFEHKDTEQLQYYLDQFKPGDYIEITRKLHGTSGRTAYVKTFQGMKRTFWDWLFRRDGEPIYAYGPVSGTRRTVMDTFEGGFYGSNEFRKQYHDFFAGKLLKGETVYYEIVGFTHDGASIMGQCSNKKLNDKEFVKQYGDTTTFSYGCSPSPLYEVITHTDGSTEQRVLKPQSRIFVYRMTMTNEDGEVIEYTPDFTRHRCMYMGVDFVPVEWSGIIPEHPGSHDDPTITAGEWVMKKVEQFYDGPEPLDPTHIREGCVVRIINRPTFTAYKHKNFAFKVLEGIIKDSADAPDMEEADGLDEEGNGDE